MSIDVKYLGITPYESTWNKMKIFTSKRVDSTQDEIWITEHEAIYTLGLNRKDFKKPLRTDISVLPVDRGGKLLITAEVSSLFTHLSILSAINSPLDLL